MWNSNKNTNVHTICEFQKRVRGLIAVLLPIIFSRVFWKREVGEIAFVRQWLRNWSGAKLDFLIVLCCSRGFEVNVVVVMYIKKVLMCMKKWESQRREVSCHQAKRRPWKWWCAWRSERVRGGKWVAIRLRGEHGGGDVREEVRESEVGSELPSGLEKVVVVMMCVKKWGSQRREVSCDQA